jgi:hypothetical protein
MFVGLIFSGHPECSVERKERAKPGVNNAFFSNLAQTALDKASIGQAIASTFGPIALLENANLRAFVEKAGRDKPFSPTGAFFKQFKLRD